MGSWFNFLSLKYICSFADHLRQFGGVFTFDRDSFNGSHFGGLVGLHPSLETPEDRTEAVARAVKCLGPELIPGIRNEVLPVVTIESVVYHLLILLNRCKWGRI